MENDEHQSHNGPASVDVPGSEDPEVCSDDQEIKYEAPRNAIEAALCEIWSSILAVERVGIHDNFLLLGGESLLGTQAASRIRARLDAEVSLRSIFVRTIAEIAAEIAGSQPDAE